MVRLSKETQEFNSWVLGGVYSKTTMKRQQIKSDLEFARRAKDSELEEGDPLKKKLDARRSQLKEERTKPSSSYQKSRFQAPASTSPRRSNSREGGTRKASPPKRRPASPPQTAENHLMDRPATLREELHQKFSQTTASRAYGTLFPPLLSPYTRPCNFLRFADKEPKVKPDVDLSQGQMRGTTLPPPSAPKETFSVAKNDRHSRPQPRSGPKAFFPTGSSATAYRCLANSAYSQRLAPAATTLGPQPQLGELLQSSKMKQMERQHHEQQGHEDQHQQTQQQSEEEPQPPQTEAAPQPHQEEQ